MTVLRITILNLIYILFLNFKFVSIPNRRPYSSEITNGKYPDQLYT